MEYWVVPPTPLSCNEMQSIAGVIWRGIFVHGNTQRTGCLQSVFGWHPTTRFQGAGNCSINNSNNLWRAYTTEIDHNQDSCLHHDTQNSSYFSKEIVMVRKSWTRYREATLPEKSPPVDKLISQLKLLPFQWNDSISTIVVYLRRGLASIGRPEDFPSLETYGPVGKILPGWTLNWATGFGIVGWRSQSVWTYALLVSRDAQ